MSQSLNAQKNYLNLLRIFLINKKLMILKLQ